MQKRPPAAKGSRSCGDCVYLEKAPIALHGIGSLTAEVIALLECDKPCSAFGNTPTTQACVEFERKKR
jgi:hypothetical protein